MPRPTINDNKSARTPKTIRIRPLSLVDAQSRNGSGDPHLSIEVDGRILPLTKFIEVSGEIVSPDPRASR